MGLITRVTHGVGSTCPVPSEIIQVFAFTKRSRTHLQHLQQYHMTAKLCFVNKNGSKKLYAFVIYIRNEVHPMQKTLILIILRKEYVYVI